jgi:hypothetical protein
LAQADRRALANASEGNDEEALLAERRPIALRVLDQLVGFRDSDGAPPSLEPVVEQNAGDLAALAGACAVAQEPAAAKATAFSASSGAADTTSKVSSTVHEPARYPEWPHRRRSRFRAGRRKEGPRRRDWLTGADDRSVSAARPRPSRRTAPVALDAASIQECGWIAACTAHRGRR